MTEVVEVGGMTPIKFAGTTEHCPLHRCRCTAD